MRYVIILTSEYHPAGEARLRTTAATQSTGDRPASFSVGENPQPGDAQAGRATDVAPQPDRRRCAGVPVPLCSFFANK